MAEGEKPEGPIIPEPPVTPEDTLHGKGETIDEKRIIDLTPGQEAVADTIVYDDKGNAVSAHSAAGRAEMAGRILTDQRLTDADKRSAISRLARISSAERQASDPATTLPVDTNNKPSDK